MSIRSLRLILRYLTGLLLLASIASVAACGAMTTSTTNTTTTGGAHPLSSPSSTSGFSTAGAPSPGALVGQVVARSSCPVRNPVSPCTLVPVSGATVTVRTTTSGAVMATATSDTHGRFRIPLPPGRYSVSAASGAGAHAAPTAQMTVDIATGHTATIQIVVSAGLPRP
jgi:hypothetical protein